MALRLLRSSLSLFVATRAGQPTVFSNSLHLSAAVLGDRVRGKLHRLNERYEPGKPERWLKYNDVVYPPLEGGRRRPAEICHQTCNIKYSPKKMWYLAALIRGLSVEEAIKQMEFNSSKGSLYIIETLKEAIEMAQQEDSVEFAQNMWVEDSFVNKAPVLKGIMKRARGRVNLIRFRFCHYYVRLREGRPPTNYYAPKEPSGWEMMDKHVQRMRTKRIEKI